MKKIIEAVGERLNWQIKQTVGVGGGDINEAFSVKTSGDKFFIKLNEAARYPGMFEAEANGLQALRQHFLLKVPAVIATGEINKMQYLVLEWLEPAPATLATEAAFGRALAQLHRATHPQFGWGETTYIGAIVQKNDWQPNWPAFYLNNRLLPLIETLRNQQVFSYKEVQQAEAFCKTLESRMPEEPPALLHGDLWSGNRMAVLENGAATTAIYDPDVYYGHRETDIAMTYLFGGFAPEFYAAYLEEFPLQKGWQQRLPLFQLYPLLVHAVLFGGGYVQRVRQIMEKR